MWFNPILKWILRSPLHGLVSSNMMLITFTGRKSGKQYTTPVSYLRDGDVLLTVSFRHRTWWRNLRGGAPITVRLAGQDREGLGKVAEDHPGVAAGLMDYLQRAPQLAKYFHVALDSQGQPVAEDVNQAAQDRVIVRIQLTDSPVTSGTPTRQKVHEH